LRNLYNGLMHKWMGFGALLGAALLYGTFSIYSRILDNDLTGFQLNFFVNSVFFLVSLGYAIFSGAQLRLPKTGKKFIVLYGLLFGIAATFYIMAILQAKIATVIFGINTSGLIVSLVTGSIFFHEKFSMKKGVSLLFAFVGLTLFTYPLSFRNLDIGLLLGLVTGCVGVLANTVGKQATGKNTDMLLILARGVGPIVSALVLVLVNHQPLLPSISSVSVLIILLFGVSILFASKAVLYGFNHFDLNLGTIVLSAELIFATLLAAIFFKEYPSTMELLGCAFIFAAILFSNLKAKK
jgi:drug/metabolite transporter (DMT)-like permease